MAFVVAGLASGCVGLLNLAAMRVVCAVNVGSVGKGPDWTRCCKKCLPAGSVYPLAFLRLDH